MYQVGNTSSRKITEAKQLGPRLTLGWVTIQGLDVDAVCSKNTVKSQKRENGTFMLLGQKKKYTSYSTIFWSNFASGLQCHGDICMWLYCTLYSSDDTAEISHVIVQFRKHSGYFACVLYTVLMIHCGAFAFTEFQWIKQRKGRWFIFLKKILSSHPLHRQSHKIFDPCFITQQFLFGPNWTT